MKFSILSLKRHLDFSLTTDSIIKLSDKLTELGLEVESLKTFNKSDYNKIIVAKIIDTNKHPNADKLKICTVTDGTDIYQIVCGAANARKDLIVALSQIGAVIPHNKMEIVKSNIRGVDSEGMMCSAKELALPLSDNNEGIVELPSNYNLGHNFFDEYNLLNYTTFEVKLTPNMCDKTSIRGVARELSHAGFGRFKDHYESKEDSYKNDNQFNIIDNTNYDNLHFWRTLQINTSNTKTPSWICDILTLSNIQIQNNIIDILNFITIDAGIPIFAFDADKINHNLAFEYTDQFNTCIAKNENFNISDKIYLIKDEINLLGLMGIKNIDKYSVTDLTKNILLVASYINPTIVAINRSRLNKIKSEASFCYERNIDPNLVQNALCYLITIIKDIYECTKISEIINIGEKKKERKIIYDTRLMQKLIGYDLDFATTKNILNKMDFRITAEDNDYLEIVVPSYRHDIIEPVNIVSTLIRIIGYSNLQTVPFSLIPSNTNATKDRILYDKIYNIKIKLSANGYREIISIPMIDKKTNEIFSEDKKNLTLQNPLNPLYSKMRQSILSNLFTAIVKNQRIDINRLAFFEEGNIFSEEYCTQDHVISGMKIGAKIRKGILHQEEKYNIFDVKNDVLKILSDFNITADIIEVQKVNLKYSHPNKSFAITVNNNTIAIFGEMHPKILNEHKINDKLYFFEIYLTKILAINNSSDKVFNAFNEFESQPIIREFAFIVSSTLTIGEIINISDNFCNENHIQDIIPLDVYRKSNDNNEQSVALKFIIRSKDPISEERINAISDNIVKHFKTHLGAKLRDGIEAV